MPYSLQKHKLGQTFKVWPTYIGDVSSLAPQTPKSTINEGFGVDGILTKSAAVSEQRQLFLVTDQLLLSLETHVRSVGMG